MAPPAAPAVTWKPAAQHAAAIALGSTITVAVHGYRFGEGNQTIYLLDALRRTNPALLAHDWFMTQTLQYHPAFTWLAQIMMTMGAFKAGFLGGYLVLVLLLHVAWRGILRTIGGDDRAYLLSVVLYYLSAAGTALGMYQFLQDSSLLPSNIANVALLWGIYLWCTGRTGWSGMCFGIAGIFHLNHAVGGIMIWLALAAWQWLGASDKPRADWRRRLALGTIAAIIPGAVNIAMALRAKLDRSGAMPLEQFIELYVRFRHPHHYDPRSWPIGLWIAFAWPIVPALLWLRGQFRRVMLILLAMLLVALLGAGVWYVSQTLVQMSLYRFGIYVQLLACAAVGVRLTAAGIPRSLLSAFLLGAVLAGACIARGPFFGLFSMPRDDTEYLALCRWARDHTPVDAIFLVPPDEQSMRLIGRRGIVINYKAVPQLSAELRQWRDRMTDVLAIANLIDLPHDYSQSLRAIRQRYDALSPEQLLATAEQYGARYVVTRRRLAGHEQQLLSTDATGSYLLYDLARAQP